MRSLIIVTAAVVAFAVVAAPSYAGKVIPDFELYDLNGENVSFYDVLASGPGPTVLSFWYVACEPCKDEHVELQNLLDEYEDDGLVVVAVSVDSSKTVSNVKPYIRGNGYTFIVLLDIDSNVELTLGVPYEPYTFLVDWEGNVIWEYKMMSPTEIQHHCFSRMPNGNTLILGWEFKSREEAYSFLTKTHI